MDWLGITEIIIVVAGFFIGFVLKRIYDGLDGLEVKIRDTESELRKEDEKTRSDVRRGEEKCEERFKELEKETRTTVKELFKLVRGMEKHLATFQGETNLKLEEIRGDVKAIRNGNKKHE